MRYNWHHKHTKQSGWQAAEPTAGEGGGCTLVNTATSWRLPLLMTEHIKRRRQTRCTSQRVWSTFNGDARPPFSRQGRQFHHPLLGKLQRDQWGCPAKTSDRESMLLVSPATCPGQRQREEVTRHHLWSSTSFWHFRGGPMRVVKAAPDDLVQVSKWSNLQTNT